MSSLSALPAPYRHWQNAARSLLEALLPYMQPGAAGIPIDGPATTNHDAQADRLESFARPLLLAAHWLQSAPHPDDAALRETIATWFREGLLIGSDPAHPDYWGPDANYHQHHVEIGLLCIGLQIARADLWEPLDVAQRAQVAHWLGTARGNGIVNNNHYFMGVHILEFLQREGFGHDTDRVVVDTFLDRLEGMYRGNGWFEDGINQAYDHYNAYAFHFYGLWWARLHGAEQPDRAARWNEWAGRFVDDYVHFFAADGSHPAFGRSICYRFNGINVFGLAAAAATTTQPLGLLRRLCTRNLDYFLTRPITQSQGLLSVGWLDEFREMAEHYSCGGSPYWAAKGFAPLILPPEHSFWHAPESPLPAEQGDHAHVMRVAGLTVRSVGGAVEIINAGSQITISHVDFGAAKWSKTAYRTGVDFSIAKPFLTATTPDSALTLHLPDGRSFARHSTVAVEMDESHSRYVWNLGVKHGQVNCGVDTAVWWNAGWLLQVHVCTNRQPGTLRLGGYALPQTDPTGFAFNDSETALHAANGDHATVLQPLLGFTSTNWDQRLDDTTPRTHLRAPFHVTPVADSDRFGSAAGEVHTLAALVWTGTDLAESSPWCVTQAVAGNWILEHAHLGRWTVTHPLLPVLP